MTALSISRLLPDAGRIVSGAVRSTARTFCSCRKRPCADVRGGKIGMIFQEPGTSLNPVMKVGLQIGEVLLQHTTLRGSAADAGCWNCSTRWACPIRRVGCTNIRSSSPAA